MSWDKFTLLLLTGVCFLCMWKPCLKAELKYSIWHGFNVQRLDTLIRLIHICTFEFKTRCTFQCAFSLMLIIVSKPMIRIRFMIAPSPLKTSSIKKTYDHIITIILISIEYQHCKRRCKKFKYHNNARKRK